MEKKMGEPAAHLFSIPVVRGTNLKFESVSILKQIFYTSEFLQISFTASFSGLNEFETGQITSNPFPTLTGNEFGGQ
jgi:hypothetical protein